MRTRTKNSGAVVIEKRPSRAPKDGMTILEKAQDKKKKVNLESNQGIPKSLNPFCALSFPEITDVAAKTGIRLGSSKDDRVKELDKIQAMDRVRVESFSKDCDMCQKGVPNGTCTLGDVVGNEYQGDVAPSTLVHLVRNDPVEVSPIQLGQWTLVRNRKKKDNKRKGLP
jgi:hypothetical protein